MLPPSTCLAASRLHQGLLGWAMCLRAVCCTPACGIADGAGLFEHTLPSSCLQQEASLQVQEIKTWSPPLCAGVPDADAPGYSDGVHEGRRHVQVHLQPQTALPPAGEPGAVDLPAVHHRARFLPQQRGPSPWDKDRWKLWCTHSLGRRMLGSSLARPLRRPGLCQPNEVERMSEAGRRTEKEVWMAGSLQCCRSGCMRMVVVVKGGWVLPASSCPLK